MAAFSVITYARFWSKVEVQIDRRDCWHWTGAKNPDGYGTFKLNGYHMGAHRVSFAMKNGYFPGEGKVVRHKCDNPSCVNPEHLEDGTVRDNILDSIQRGRYKTRCQIGSSNAASKLTEHDVEAIRERIDSGETNTAIARKFGVHHATISAIRRGKTWAA